MSDPDQVDATQPALRGEAAWRAHRDAVGARNDKAKKAGKERHDAWEQVRARSRQEAELREDARFIKKQRAT